MPDDIAPPASPSLPVATDANFAEAMIDASPDGLILADAAGDIAYANRQAADMFGYSLGEFIGTSVDDLLPEGLRGAHRAHRTRYRAHPEVRAMGIGLDLLGLRRDGSTFHAEISLSPLAVDGASYVVAAVRDVSERIAAEDHFHRVLRSLDATDDAIMVFDAATLRYSHVSEGAVRMLGYDQVELATMTPLHLNPYTAEAEYRELVDELLANPDTSIRRESRMLTRSGGEIPVEKSFRAAPAARDGSQWIIIVARDISERLEAEAELERNREELVLAEDRARIARDLHDTVIQRLFGAGLRLQAITAIADDRVRDRLEETIDDLDETIRELRSTIFSLQTAHQRPTGLRGELLAVITEVGQSTGLDIRLQFDGAIDTIDPDIARHVVPTLREALSNVAKHAAAHHVRVVVSSGDHVVVTVTDDGVGIAGEVLGGHGLTNLAHRAETLGGSLEVATADDGGGTRFRWWVPASTDSTR
jgi:PAS domain S-box-containing protein